MTKVVFFCQTAKYLRVKCYFSGKNLAEYILLTIFALDYCNDVLTNMRKTYNDKLLVLVLFCMYSSAAFAQKEDMSTILDIHHLMAYLVAALLISVFVMAYFNRVFYYREKEVRNRSERLNTQMGLVMDSNKTRVWTYDRQKNVFRLLSYVTGESKDLTAIDFSQDFDRDDFLEMREVIHSILEKETLSQSLFVKGAIPKGANAVQPLYEINLSIMRRDRHNAPTVILGIQTDITDDKAKTEQAQKLQLRYHTVFNSLLVDMIFYDENGTLSDINEKACETFGITDRQALLQRKVDFHDIPSYRNIDLNGLDTMQLSSITDIDAVKKADERIPELTIKGKMYYEAMVSAIHDAQGQLLGIIAAGRDITDMVESNHHQEEGTRMLEKTTQDIKAYIDNINYSLKVSDVRLMNYYPDTHELEISSDLNKTQYKLPQLRAITMICEQERRKAKGLFRRMDRRHPGTITDTLRTLMRDSEGRSVYLNFNIMPITDADGRITHYFGMCRNETEMTYTEMKLREETEKAQETEKLKNQFLLNMSYELRTPLSAVIGFAELFNGEHSEEDEPIFAEEIKKNTGELLKLINDILFISRLDSRMIEFNYQECDFATMFDGWCYMGWSTLNPSIKVVVENPYNRLMASIDSQNLGMVIQKICTFSASTVSEVIVRAKYEYRHGELMITIEDTGRGISKTDLPHAFERFVRNEANEHFGSGLDLPIVQELLEQMGGSIEIQSESGKGTTFYISVPCQSSNFEKKSEIIV